MVGISDKGELETFCIKFAKIIEKYTKYIVVSGFVAIAAGRTRATEDIDMIVSKIPEQKFIKLHNDLTRNDFVCKQTDDPKEIYEYLRDNLSVRYTEKNKPLPEMEIKFSKDKLDEYQLENRQKIPFTGLNIWFSSIEMNIAFKEEYLKSNKDLEDAHHLRKLFKEQINEQEINEIKKMIKKIKLK